MAVSRGVGGIIASVVGIIIILAAVLVIAKVMGSDAPIKPLIYKSIELRDATDPLNKADLITSLDNLVVQAKNDEVTNQWDRMMQCLATSCPDEAFLDMVLVTVAAFEMDIPESAVLINIIATAKYWNDSEHLLDFSKALSIANEQVDDLESRKARKIWDDIVECKGTCPEKNDLYFDLIKNIVQ